MLDFMQTLHIAGYKFITLKDLHLLQAIFIQRCETLALKGTVLLSEEGMNINLAGHTNNIIEFKSQLYADERFKDITFCESHCAFPPFKRLKIKIKKEIITFRRKEIQPAKQRTQTISPEQFKQWLDEKRDITILDTRNDYEVKFGTFNKAAHLHISDFSEFIQAADNLTNEKPIVLFCTGGIRCEKAGLHLLNNGFPDVYQLAGGILNYFSKMGGAHYNGECFVFDERIALNASLQSTGTLQCKTCQGPIKQRDPFCFTCHPHLL
jgi:UPF0176 protein